MFVNIEGLKEKAETLPCQELKELLLFIAKDLKKHQYLRIMPFEGDNKDKLWKK